MRVLYASLFGPWQRWCPACDSRASRPRAGGLYFGLRALCLLLLLGLSSVSAWAQCTGNIVLSSQAQVDMFPRECNGHDGDIIISGADITDLSPLSNLQSISGGSLLIRDNPELTSLTGLEKLTSCQFELALSNNAKLVSLAGLSGIVSVGSGLKIQTNPTLTSIAGLSSLRSVGDNLIISSNPELTSLTGLEQLTSAGGLQITSNAKLLNLTGLNSLGSVANNLIVSSNPELTSLTGLEQLTTAGGLKITSNVGLTSIAGLSSLRSVANTLIISSNPDLTSLTGLEHLTTARNLVIYDNAKLSTCAIDGVCQFIANYPSKVSISANAPGCATVGEVQANCNPGTVTALSPARNARAAARATDVSITLNKPWTGPTSLVTVWSQQAGGKKAGTATVSGNSLTFNLTTDFKPGETVLVTAAKASGLVKSEVYQFTTAAAKAPGTFSGGSEVGVGNKSLSVTTADVDGDGDLDFLTANRGSDNVSVRLNNGNGTFSAGSEVAVGSLPNSVMAADVDGDGDLDFLTANRDSDNVSVRLNHGDGTFSAGSEVNVGSGPVSVVGADVDGDGDLDFLAANFNSNTVSVRLNNGTGTFSAGSEVNVGKYVNGVAAADVDGDGDLDFLAANYFGNGTVSVRLNNGKGTFSGSSEVTIVGGSPYGVTAADVDGDGDLDFLAVNNSDNGTVSVRLNALPPTITTPPASTAVCAGSPATFSVVASNATSYQWQVSSGSDFTDLPEAAPYSGVTTNKLTLSAPTAALNGYQYRVVASGVGTPAATSAAATLTVNEAPNITTPPDNATVTAGDNASFSSVATGTGTGLTYQWQVSSGSGFTNLSESAPYSGVTTNKLTITGTTTQMSGYQYQLVVSGTCAPAATSGAATLTVNAPSVAPTLTFNDVHKTFGDADFALTTTSNSSGAYTYSVQSGTGATVTPAGQVTLTGAGSVVVRVDQAANGSYTAGSATATLTIDKAPATVTLADLSQTYSGSARAASASTSATGTSSFTLTYNGAAQAPTQAGQYAVVATLVNDNYKGSATGTLVVAPKPVTATLVASNKVYDGKVSASATSSIAPEQVATNDELSVQATTVAFDTKQVGTGKTVTASGLSLSGAAASNYSLTATTTTAKANITARPLVVTATGVNKVYDGTTPATVTLGDDRLSGDVFTTAYASAIFADANVGTGKTVTVTGISLSGADASNYSGNTTASTTADITPATPQVVATAPTSLRYSGTPKAGTGTATGVGGSTDVLSPAPALSYVGTNSTSYGPTATAPTSVGDYTVTAKFAGNNNYNPKISDAVPFSISPAPLTVTTVAASKPYGDANPSFAVSYTGFVNNETKSVLGGTLVFTTAATASSPVGSYSVTPGGLTSTNYSLTFTPANLTIQARPLTVTATGVNKAYDGTTTATVSLSDNRLSGDALTTAYTNAAFADANVGKGKSASVAGISLGGSAASNYTLTAATATATADITARPLTVTATGLNKVYDGTTAAAVSLSDNRLSGDALTTSYTSASFDTKMVGTAKKVTVNGISLGGAAASNYSLTATTATTTADITALVTTASFTAADKVYDRTTAATVTGSTVTAALPSDVVTLVGGVATFDNKNVGTGKTVTLTGATLSGADAANYRLTTVSSATANITARPLVITATGVNKVYDGTTAATVTLSDNRLSGDVLTTAYTSASFAAANVGTGKQVTVTGISLSGADAGNYSLTATTASTTADITQATPVVAVSTTGPTQYSDQVTLTATLTSASAQTALNTTGGTVAFTLVSGSTSVPLGTTTYPGDWRVVNGVATASKAFTISQPADTYSVLAVFTPATSNFASANGTGSLVVNTENASVVYSGLEYFGTANSTSSTANVEYIATLTDAADASRGTITNAVAVFKDASATPEAVLYGPKPYAVQLLSASDPTVGGARTGVQTVTLTSAEYNNGGKTFDLVAEAQGNYYTGRTADHTLITVAVPGQDYVTGGGSVLIGSQSTGSYAATPGSKMNFGFTMKWNKSGKNIQGQMNLLFRRLVSGVWRTYQVKSNAINTLGTGTTSAGNQGDFNTKATLTDVTNPLNPISLGGAMDLSVQALESTVSGAPHKIGVTLRDNSGILLFSNNWVNGRTEMQALNGGKINVRSSTSVTTTSTTQRTTLAVEAAQEPGLTNLLEVYPNPMAEQATLRFHTAEGGKAQVYVYDQVGRLVTTLYNAEVQRGQDYYLSLKRNDYETGLYFCRLIANGEVFNVRLTIVK
jgi:hypothetical protein